jgi:Fe-S cluster biogenesis protein NfuA
MEKTHMTEYRTKEEIVRDIKQILVEYVDPFVAQHGGQVNYKSFDAGVVLLEMSGACSGCAGSTMTLKHGIQNLLCETIPEVNTVEGMDDPNSGVDPFMTTDPYYMEDHIDQIMGDDFDTDQ